MADVDYPRVARSLVVPHYALRAHVCTTACLLLLLLYCSPTSAFRPISRQIVSKLPARRGSSARMVPPRVVQFLAARRAERASAGGRRGGYYSRSASSAVRASSSAAAPQASAVTTAALTAIFTAALLPIPAKKPNACTWPGVSCAANGGAVEQLYFDDYIDFDSPRPPPRTPRLCNSTARVPGVKFPATLSDSIGQLTGLTNLGVSYLWLAGSVPQSFSRLDLSYNCFVGPLPVAIFRMQRLSEVLASHNFFSGGLPQGPAAYAATSLENLDLGYNRLSGPIPAALATLPMLNGILMSSNRLTGNIPPAILEREGPEIDIILDQNRLSDDLSRQQIKANIFCVSGNKLSGDFNSINFAGFYVGFINVSNNLFSGSFPQILCRPGASMTTDFSRNRLTGAVPANCFNSENTPVELFFSHNNFSGSLQPFTKLPYLSTLDLGFNKFTWSIPQGLTRLDLQTLDLRRNALTGTTPAFCKGEDPMFYLNLAFNALSGPPNPLSSPACAASLEYLNLASNRLSGPIPATISSFTNLTRLRLDKNTLTGAIPAGVSNMKQLRGLGLSYNNLLGKIPAVWPAKVRQVLLAGNRLSGAVPAALSKLKLGSFNPGNDNLCGTPLPACS